MSNLMRVRGNGCVLYFPQSFQHPELLRGGRGLVVDMDAPFEREWCAGQEYKLEPAPADAVASPIRHPVARRLLAEWEAAHPEAVKPPAPPKPAPAKPALPSDDDLDEAKRATRKTAKAGAA